MITKHHGGNGTQFILPADIWKPDRPIPFLGLTGARGCGKTKLLEFLFLIFGPTLFGFDSSKVCDELKNESGNEIGKELLQFEARRKKGEMYPCELVIRVYMYAIKRRLDGMKHGEIVRCIGMAGAPRSKRQDELLTELGFILSLIHIQTDSLRQVFIGMLRRNKGGEKRIDDNIESAVNNFEHYEDHIKPYASRMSRDRAITIKFGDPLIEKVDACAQFIARVLGGDFVTAFERFMDVNNPLRVEIVKFDHANSGEIVLTRKMQEAVDTYQQRRLQKAPGVAPVQLATCRLSQMTPSTYGGFLSQR